MPRRSPPSSLRLSQGPTPSRDTPKHKLPSLPRPAFQNRVESSSIGRLKSDSEIIVIAQPEARNIRGPWDHSGSISIKVDVDSLLPRLNRAMIVLRG